MRGQSARWPAVLTAVLLVATAGAEDGTLPVIDGHEVLASVNGEPVTSEDLRWQIGSMHESIPEAESLVARPDPSALLQRLINAKLIVQEARAIGLDELPDVVSTLETGHNEMVKRFLIDERLKDIHAGDPAVVEDLYRQIVREVLIRPVLFQSREDATSFESAVRGGMAFEQAAEPFVESGEAVLHGADYVKVREMRPELAPLVLELEPGSITAPIDVRGGIAVVLFLEERIPEDPEVRANAEETALTYRKQDDLRVYTDELRERYAKVNEKVLDSLDFDSSETDLDAYREDDRVVARVKGAKPVTVAELSARVAQLFYHGMEKAAERNRVNDKLPGVLDRIILERAMVLEARRFGIEASADFQSARKSQEAGVLFGAFLSKVVNPEVKLPDEQVEAFYAEHVGEYMTPAMIRLQGIAFTDREHAETSLEKLRQGSDLNWTRANASGLADESTGEVPLLDFDGRVLSVQALPEGIRKAVDGASTGDFRLYAQPDGAVYVLAVEELIQSKAMEFAEVRDKILQRMFLIERAKVLETWTDELRTASEIEIHANENQLAAVLGLGSVEGQ